MEQGQAASRPNSHVVRLARAAGTRSSRRSKAPAERRPHRPGSDPGGWEPWQGAEMAGKKRQASGKAKAKEMRRKVTRNEIRETEDEALSAYGRLKHKLEKARDNFKDRLSKPKT